MNFSIFTLRGIADAQNTSMNILPNSTYQVPPELEHFYEFLYESRMVIGKPVHYREQDASEYCECCKY